MAVYAAESPRLYLQSLNMEDHLLGLHRMLSNPECSAWSSKQLYTDIQQTRDLISVSLPTPEKPWNERWAIMLKPVESSSDEAQMIGMMGVVREGEIGYRIHPDWWKQGFMTEALAIFAGMFWDMPVHKDRDRILAAADTQNIASIRTLEKAGFMKGEIKVGFYERRATPGVKSDLQFFYLPRPIR